MLTPRFAHGCVTTDDGEVLIAGWYDGDLSSVHIFNPVTLEWCESESQETNTIETNTPLLQGGSYQTGEYKLQNWTFQIFALQ